MLTAKLVLAALSLVLASAALAETASTAESRGVSVICAAAGRNETATLTRPTGRESLVCRVKCEFFNEADSTSVMDYPRLVIGPAPHRDVFTFRADQAVTGMKSIDVQCR